MASEGLIQVLIDHGYTFEGVCNCDGFRTWKYRNKDHQFRWRVNKGEFKIKEHGHTKTNWRAISLAETVLNELDVVQA